MKHRHRKPLTRQQILDLLMWTSADVGFNISCTQFLKMTGVALTQIQKHFGNWTNLRVEAGLTPSSVPGKRWTVDDLCAKYHACVEKLGHFPSVQQFELHSGISASTFYRRVGKLPDFQQHYARWLRLQTLPDPTGYNRQIETNPARDVAWLRNRWFNLRVGFELRSSDFKGREPDACDFLVVLEHDWPPCPVRTVELHEVLPRGSERPIPAASETFPIPKEFDPRYPIWEKNRK